MMQKAVFAASFLAVLLQVALSQDEEHPVQLGNNVEDIENPFDFAVKDTSTDLITLLTDALQQLQQDNAKLREELRRSNAETEAQLLALRESDASLREENERLREEMISTFSQLGNASEENSQRLDMAGPMLMRDVRMLMLPVEVEQERLAYQLSLTRQSVNDTANALVQQAALCATTTTDLHSRLSAVQAQMQVNGECACSEEDLVGLKQRVDALETSLNDKLYGQSTLNTVTPPSPSPSNPPSPPSPPPTPSNAPSPPNPTGPSSPPSPSPNTIGFSESTPPTIGAGELVFSRDMSTVSDGESLVTSILMTTEGKLIVGDRKANRINVFSIANTNQVTFESHYNTYADIPWDMTQLSDGSIAVTMEESAKIVFFRLNENKLHYVTDTRLPFNVGGIAEGPNNTLVLSKWREQSVARIVVVDRDTGNVLKTLLEDVDYMINPFCVRVYGEDAYVSDWTSHRVFKVNVNSGEVSFQVGELDLKELSFMQPRKMDFDEEGNLYVATGGRVCNPDRQSDFCVVRISQSGQWQKMESYTSQRGGGYPYALEVTSDLVLVSWNWWSWGWSAEVTAYSLG